MRGVPTGPPAISRAPSSSISTPKIFAERVQITSRLRAGKVQMKYDAKAAAQRAVSKPARVVAPTSVKLWQFYLMDLAPAPGRLSKSG